MLTIFRPDNTSYCSVVYIKRKWVDKQLQAALFIVYPSGSMIYGKHHQLIIITIELTWYVVNKLERFSFQWLSPIFINIVLMISMM